MQGGGWCNNIRTCVYRKTTRRGSSKYMEKMLAFTGILSNKPEENPGLYHFNSHANLHYSLMFRFVIFGISELLHNLTRHYRINVQIFSIGIE